MKKFLFLFVLLSISIEATSQSLENNISGIVTEYGQPMPRVNISVKGTSKGVQTDVKGKYTIQARPRDVLVFSYVGMQTVEIIVEDVTKVLNIQMEPKIEALDEVIVEQKIQQNQQQLFIEYGNNKNIIRTSFGYLDTENAGYAVNIIDGKELNPAAIDILSALQTKLPGTRIVDYGSSQTGGGPSGRGLFIRGSGSANNPKPAIFEVDG
ncbi:MAG: carboxypeptidase-like regulatory domain-containing protein, partial [Flavobacteriaceae bacterium]